MSSTQSLENHAHRLLVGKKITAVRYMTVAEAEEKDWSHRPLIIFFDDGTSIFASKDDEGNDAGVITDYSGRLRLGAMPLSHDAYYEDACKRIPNLDAKNKAYLDLTETHIQCDPCTYLKPNTRIEEMLHELAYSHCFNDTWPKQEFIDYVKEHKFPDIESMFSRVFTDEDWLKKEAESWLVSFMDDVLFPKDDILKGDTDA